MDRTERHRSILTFQPGPVDMLEKNATKVHLVHVAGKLQTWHWRKNGECSVRFSTDILLVPGGHIQSLDKANGEAPSRPADHAPIARPDERDVRRPYAGGSKL